MTETRKLIEVSLPLEEISKASRRDKDRSTGTIKNIHKWFAPMPTPAWRALLFAALIDDPGDRDGRAYLLDLIRRLTPEQGQPPSDETLKEARQLLQGIGSLPLVFDPFCGGGSTVVEAQRLGLPALASDLNPVAVLITRTLTELVPKIAGREPLHLNEVALKEVSGGPLEGFITDLYHYARRIRETVQKEIGHLYPQAHDGSTVYAWLWARTVICPNPPCRTVIPLYTSPWLSRQRRQEVWLKPYVVGKQVRFEIGTGEGATPEPVKIQRGAKFRCPACNEITEDKYVRREGREGRMGLQLLALATHGGGKRSFLAAQPADEAAAQCGRPDDVPDLLLPDYTRDFKTPIYGLKTLADLFLPRQLHALAAFADAVTQVPQWVESDGGDAGYAQTMASVLGLCVGKLAQSSSTQVRWRTREGPSKIEPAFGRHAIPMVWDFGESNPFGGSRGDWLLHVESTVDALLALPRHVAPAHVVQEDARVSSRLIEAGRALIATDPPYFAQIGYADLSDYFYVWLRRALRSVHPDLFATISVPKNGELVAAPYRHGGETTAHDYFVEGFTSTFRSLVSRSRSDLPMLVVYAHRQEESKQGGLTSTAWDAMLEAILEAGLSVVGTWPIHATTTTRQIGMDANALASCIVLVCRPRRSDARIVDKQTFVRALRARLPEALRELQEGAIAPVDLAQAAIGPGMAVFSRYAKVIEPIGEPMRVRTALGLINRALSEVLTEQEGEFDPETRWAVKWFEQFGFDEGPFATAEVLFTATATSLDGLKRSGIVGSRPGKVWLLDRDELSADWDPKRDRNVPVWEATLNLLKRLDEGGERSAAELLAELPDLGDAARDLAYRLYAICERRKWNREALKFNSLVVSWPEIAKQTAGGSGGMLTIF